MFWPIFLGITIPLALFAIIVFVVWVSNGISPF